MGNVMNGFGKAAIRVCGTAGRAAVAAAAAGLGALALGWAAMEAAVRWAPYPEGLLERFEAGRVAVDCTGEPLRVWLNEGQDCRPSYEVREGDWIAAAVVAAEDGRFWRHRGVDWLALARAVWQNAVHGRRVSGASTISTQVWRLAEPRPRTIHAKVSEWIRAMQLERRAGKGEILGQYLNRAPFGGNVTGIEAAARRWFGKSAHDLNLSEAALLAGVPQSPSRFRPDRGGEALRARQGYVLRRMRELGMITEGQEREAAEEGRAVARAWGYPRRAEHFAEWVGGMAGAADGRGEIRTTLDPETQATAERVLRAKLAEADFEGISGAVVVIDVASGGVRAMVGSPDFHALPAGQVNGTLAARGAGSTLKPFAFAAAFDGGWLTPDSVLADREVQFRDYAPRNFSGRFRGRATAREALVDSLNLPAIAVVRRLGAERFLEVLRAAGLGTLRRSAEEYGAGLALGGAEVRLLELANAYACLARGGVWKPVAGLAAEAERIRGEEGRRVFSEGAAWLVWDILSGEERAMDLTGHELDTPLPPMAWKTGTSAGLRDAWAVAWNGRRVVGVWMGRVDGKGASVLVGRRAAVPVAWGIFRELAGAGEEGPERPEEVEERRICTESGCLAGERCPVTSDGYCLRRRTVWSGCPLAHEGGEKDGDDTAEGEGEEEAGGDETGAGEDEATESAGVGGVRIVVPADGAVYRAMPRAGEGDGEPVCRLTLRGETTGGGRLYWFLDGMYAGTTAGGGATTVTVSEGRHEVGCADEAGGAARAEVTVEE